MFAGGGGGGSSDSEGDVFDTDDEHYDDEDEDLLFVEASSAWSMRVGAGGASGEKEGDSEVGTSASGGGADEGADEQDTADAAAAAANEASTEASEGAGQSQPLRTLKKLQAMLDDSDYATAATASLPVESPTAGTAAAAAKLAFGDDAAMATQQAVPAVATTSTSVSSQQPPPLPPVPSEPKPQQQRSQQPEKLWTSKDRSKYKKQRRLRQERERREKEQLEEQRRKWQQAGLSSSEDGDESTRKGTADGNHGAAAAAAVAATVATDTDDDGFLTDGTTTEDDGLGYSLPNLPVYLSDSEGNSDDFELLDDEGEDRGGPPPPTAQQFQQQQEQAYVPQQQQPQLLSQSQYQYQPSSAAAGYNQLINGNHQQPLPGDPYQQAYPQYNPYQYYQQQQQGGQYSQPPPMNYPYPYPNQYNQQQYAQYAQQYAAWAEAAAAAQATSGGSNGYPPPSLPPQSRQQSQQQGPPPYQQSNYNNNVQRPYPQQQQGPYTQGGFMPQPYAVAPRPSAGQGSTGSPRGTQASTSTKANGKSKKSDDNVASSQYQSQGNGAQDVFPPQQQVPPAVPFVPHQPMPMEMMHVTDYSQEVSLAEASANISFDSIQKLVFVMVGVMLMSYCAVSPRTLPVVEYNMRFKENLQIVSLVLIAPVIISISVFDAKESDINRAISTFTSTFTLGYVMCFVCEIVWTTILRLGVFLVWEPQIFKLTPRVPMVVLPWVLRENKYRPKRITLFAADFATSCVAAPIIEEYIKLKLVQLGGRLPRNYRKVKKKKERDSSNKNKAKKKRKRYALEKIERAPGEAEVTNVNVFVTQMLAASVGLKLCDSARRILMYTKRTDASKSFYAFARGVFPIHELCGTMTAIELAKRDLLGVDLPLWRILLPAVFIHGMANFRGMKPLFKWNSSTPWSEMQLSPWNVADDSTLGQMVSKGLAKLMWLIILGRVLGYCIKNYYLVKRQAIKRTTTYAGKQAAFSAELAAAQYLKKTKKQKGKNNQD